MFDPFAIQLPAGAWVFLALGLAIVAWTAVDTATVLRLLSYNRRTTFTKRQLTMVRLPAMICLVGLILLLIVGVLNHM